MTSQADFGLRNCRIRNMRVLAINVITIVTLITIVGILAPMGQPSINAQMTADHEANRLGNMTSSQQQQHDQTKINNVTIDLEQVIFQAINSKINISLTQAMTTAEKLVGNDAFAVAAFGSEENGHFAYRIILATPVMEFYWIKVDPGNGQILETQQISQKELDKMHREQSAMVVTNNGSHSVGVSGFPFINPH
jgi:uncharacterized membrane protein YkoI